MTGVLDAQLFGDLGPKLVIAISSVIAGALLSRWWDRARPFILLQGFGGSIVPGESVNLPDELLKLTQDSWNMEALSSKLTTVAIVKEVYGSTRDASTDYRVAEEWLPILSKNLEEATTDETAIEYLRQIMSLKGVTHAISTALKRSELTVTSEQEQPTRNIVPYGEHPSNGGCYHFWWKGMTTEFSSNLTAEAFVKPRLQPFVDAVSRLDKAALLKIFNNVLPFIARQARVHTKLLDIVRPIHDERTRWSAKVWLANYGAAPVIVWPDCVISIKSRNASFSIVGQLNLECDTAPRIRDMFGPHIVAPGDSVTFWASTTQAIRNIPDGHILSAYYTSGGASGSVMLHVTQRGPLLGSRRRSARVTFEETISLPE